MSNSQEFQDAVRDFKKEVDTMMGSIYQTFLKLGETIGNIDKDIQEQYVAAHEGFLKQVQISNGNMIKAAGVNYESVRTRLKNTYTSLSREAQKHYGESLQMFSECCQSIKKKHPSALQGFSVTDLVNETEELQEKSNAAFKEMFEGMMRTLDKSQEDLVQRITLPLAIVVTPPTPDLAPDPEPEASEEAGASKSEDTSQLN